VQDGLAALAGFLQQDFRLTAAETGLLITASYAAPLFALLFVGDLLDRKSEPLIFGLGAGVLFAAMLLAAASRDYAVLLLCLLVAGLGSSVTQPGGSKSVSVWFRGDRLGLAMGIRQAGLPLGGAAAAAILPAVATAWSWRAAFAAGAAAALGGGLAFALIYRPPDGDRAPKRPTLSFSLIAALLQQRWMRNAMIAGLALVAAQYGILTWLMLYLRDHAHIALARGAWFLFLAQAAGTNAPQPPSGAEWLHEIKHDGFRVIARKNSERVRLYSRPGNDLTDRFPLIVEALSRLRASSCILDGEAVVCGNDGIACFEIRSLASAYADMPMIGMVWVRGSFLRVRTGSQRSVTGISRSIRITSGCSVTANLQPCLLSSAARTWKLPDRSRRLFSM
jgi:Major Facilitator Superfamily/ATP dependent DNA ligase domain